MDRPEIILFNSIGSGEIGYISVAESPSPLPFQLQRIFWTYYTPHHVIRGRHTHYKLEQVLIAVAGTINVSTESPAGEKAEYILDKPNEGLYLPPLYWHTMQFTHNAVMVSLASMKYNEDDYIRNYDEFLRLRE